MMTDEPYQPEKEIPGNESVDSPGNSSRFLPGDPGRMALCDFDPNVSARIPNANDQDSALLQL
jgi:hypothetical protein